LKQLIVIAILITANIGYTQSFSPAVGFEGSRAIYKDSSIFISWAKNVIVSRGFKNIAAPQNGKVTYGIDSNAIGKADGNPSIVSLGDGGSAIISFESPIANGLGADFAIFENGFLENDSSERAFLEFAFVEVSTNGVEYIRFPAISEIPSTEQTDGFENSNARYIYNLAGKYTQFYGTPFDLDDIVDLTIGTSVKLNEINYIKIIDVIGCVTSDFASLDSIDNIINDPYPTEYPSGGFDLDAVGVINNQTNTKLLKKLLIYPNPVKEILHFKTEIKELKKVTISSICGKTLISSHQNNTINVSTLKKGIYILQVYGTHKSQMGLFFKTAL